MDAVTGPRQSATQRSLRPRNFLGLLGGSRGGEGLPDPPPPCSGEARKTRTGRDDAPPQCWRRVVGCPGCGAVGLGLLGASGLARPAQPLAEWRRRVPRPARPGVVSGGGVWEPGSGRFPAGLAGRRRGTERTSQGRDRRFGKRTEQAKAQSRQHVLSKPPEPGHRGQGLCPGDGVQTRPLPTQPVQ